MKINGRVVSRIKSALIVAMVFFAFQMGANNAHAKYASLIIDSGNGEVLHSVNADTRNYPASLTKMMTLYLMFEALDEGRIKLTDKIVFSRRAARQPS